MNQVSKHFQLDLEPEANSNAIIKGPKCRFIVLTSRLIRMEYDPDNNFEDRASQIFWYRKQSVPDFKVQKTEKSLKIETDYLVLSYEYSKNGFTEKNLKIKLKKSGTVWHYGDDNQKNLKGTARTLDDINGSCKLEKGLLSRDGWAVVEDDTLVFTDDCWFIPRENKDKKTEDIYFFGYGEDYLKCIKDFTRISGEVSLLPRWVLGNWWSKYWDYTQEELKQLMLEFKNKGIPLSVCIIDMDWHIVKNEYTNGWTGFTWNRDLFPEPEGFVEWLHKMGLKTALNLHPADGIHPHEKQYQEIAKFMGINPDTEKPVEFDITDPKFMEGFFKKVLNPLEDQGIDFWWIDWQQGDTSKIPGLDPLWGLNHLHFLDRQRSGKRPFIFSRWAGLGNQRYPIGFSGDTIVSWASLQFQPYFTTTASNVAYGWWSHDIGGHYAGQEDPELYTRWVQFGVFSPIMRLHSSKTEFLERRPWGYDENTFKASKKAMRLRHAMLPYLYTMNWRNHSEHIPLINPMYYHHPQQEEAYCCPDQYYFGSEIIVAPFTKPVDSETNLSRQVVWLPEGNWFDFFTGEYYHGDSWNTVYGDINKIPVFAREGAIIPMIPEKDWGGVENPEVIELQVFPGADNDFELYEDDGKTLSYKKGKYAITKFSQKWSANKLQFKIKPVEGDLCQIPETRSYNIIFKGVNNPQQIKLKVNGKQKAFTENYNQDNQSLIIKIDKVDVDSDLQLVLTGKQKLLSKKDRSKDKFIKTIKKFSLPTEIKLRMKWRLNDQEGFDLDFLKEFLIPLSDRQIKTIVEMFYEIGVNYINIQGNKKIVLWNNKKIDGFKYQLGLWSGNKGKSVTGQVKSFKTIDFNNWQDYSELSLDYNFLDILRDTDKFNI